MLLDPTALGQLSTIDPSIAAALAAMPDIQIPWNDPVTIKQTTARLEGMIDDLLGPLEDTLQESYDEFALRDGTIKKVKIHRPTPQASTGRPLIVLYFGGGFISGGINQMTQYARGLVRAFDAVVVCPDYRLSPEFVFPTHQEDSFDALKWVAKNALRLGADPSKGFIVGGSSAGANCAAAIVRMAQGEPLEYAITGQWLAIPPLFRPDIVPEKYRQYFLSREQNAKSKILDQDALTVIGKFTKWDGPSTIPWPTLSHQVLSEVPATYLQVCGMDPLRDDVSYTRRY